MVDKHEHKLPRIQSHTDTNDSLARSIGRIDFEIQRLQSNATWKEKQNRWSSSNFVRYEGRSNFKKNQMKNGLRQRSESLVRPDEALSRQGQERKADNPSLKRYNSEPFLQQTYDEFSVQATSLKLNNRNKDESRKSSYSGGFLPPVFLDPKLSADNPVTSKQIKLESAKTIKMIRDFENSRKILVKNQVPVEEKLTPEKLSKGSKTIRKSESKRTKNIEESGEDNPKIVKRKGLLPKRRLSEQVDSYEVSRTVNDQAFPRRITIRTSKSCPTIVIHECGDNEDTSSEIGKNIKYDNNVENGGEIGNIGEDDLTVHRSRTTSLVACWKPKQSVVNEK